MINNFQASIRENKINLFDDKKDLIQFISDKYKENHLSGHRVLKDLFPPMTILKDRFHLTQEELLSLMKQLSTTGMTENNIYKYYSGELNDNLMVKVARKPKEKKTIEQPEIKDELNPEQPEDKIIIPEKKQEVKKVQPNININLFKFFRIIIAFVGICFVYIGVKYVFYGNMKNFNNKDYIDAFICAFAFLLMSIICLEFTIFFIIKKNLLFILFAFIYFILFCYNTGTILYYKYDVYLSKNVFSDEKIQTKKDLNKISEIKNNIDDLQSKKNNIQSSRDLQFNLIKNIDSQKGDNTSDKLRLKYERGQQYKILQGIDNQLSQINNEIKTARDEKITTESNNSGIFQEEKHELFSGWVLALYLFLPSFAIELLASICLALLLFIKFE